MQSLYNRKILTISIAAYNCEKYIEEALNSLCDEEVLPYLEVFIVDDGGTDRTLEIAKKYREKYGESFIPVHKENGGWGSTVNYSIEHATGKYFRLLDGDDYFNRAGLKELINLLRKIDVDLVYSAYRRFEDLSSKTIEQYYATKDVVRNQEIDIKSVDKKIIFAMHSSTFNTKILKGSNIRITEHCFYTDTEYVAKCLAKVSKVWITDIMIYEYRIGRTGQSVDLAGLSKHYKENFRVIEEMIRYRNDISSEKRSALDRYIELSVKFHYTALLLLNKKSEFIEFDQFVKNNKIPHNNDYYTNMRSRKYIDFAAYRMWRIMKKKIGKLLKIRSIRS